MYYYKVYSEIGELIGVTKREDRLPIWSPWMEEIDEVAYNAYEKVFGDITHPKRGLRSLLGNYDDYRGVAKSKKLTGPELTAEAKTLIIPYFSKKVKHFFHFPTKKVFFPNCLTTSSH